MKKIALFGGTGFVGSYLIDRLIADNWQPIVLARPGSEHKIEHKSKCTLVSGEISDEKAIANALKQADAAIHNIGILREHPKQGIHFEDLHHQCAKTVINAAEAANVSRFLLMSANGVKERGTTYQRTKYAAERHLAQSTLNWTIFRPSVLFGDPRGRMEFATQLYKDVIKSPLPAPLFFSGWNIKQAGQLMMAPAWVGDVAEAFVRSLQRKETFNKTIELCGPEKLSWREILQRICKASGRTKLMLPAPTGPISAAATVLDRYAWFPLTREQIVMLMEGNVCVADGFASLGIEPQPFSPEALGYLRSSD